MTGVCTRICSADTGLSRLPCRGASRARTAQKCAGNREACGERSRQTSSQSSTVESGASIDERSPVVARSGSEHLSAASLARTLQACAPSGNE